MRISGKRERRAFQKQLLNGIILVFRFNNTKDGSKKKLEMSAPCQDCLAYMKKKRNIHMIKEVVYSNKQGYLEGKILRDMSIDDCYVSSGFSQIKKTHKRKKIRLPKTKRDKRDKKRDKKKKREKKLQ